MKKKIFALLAFVMIAMTASAEEAPSYTIAKKANDVTIKVNGTEATTAKENDVVTVVVTPPEGKYAATVVCRPYTTWNVAKTRATGIELSGNFLADKVEGEANTFSFKMPAKNVEVGVTYVVPTIDVNTQETGGQEKPVNNVNVDVALAGDVYQDTETGQTVVPIEVTTINVPVQEERKDLTVEIPSETVSEDGETVYVVTSINKDAFKTEDGSNAQVVAVILPVTKDPIAIEDGAMQPEGRTLKVIAPLAMLDDYGNMTSLKENVEQGKVSATATPVNKYWTFSSGIDVLLPPGVKAYKAMWADDAIQIEELTDDELKMEGDQRGIKKNNGVLLACDSGKGGDDYEMVVSPAAKVTGAEPATTDAKDYEGNSLVPTIKAFNYAAGQYLILFANEFHSIASNLSEVPPCKAVLKLEK